MAFSTGAFSRWGQQLLRAGALGATVLGAQACIIVDPLPTDESSISGTWTVDGLSPNAASCAAIGMDTVELVLYAPSGTSPLLRLSAPCAGGTVDSRATDVFISAGDYQYAFDGYLGTARVATGDRSPIRLVASDHGRVTANFLSPGFNPAGTDATAEATWTINGATATAATCAALGIAEVRVAFQNGSAWYELPALTAPCSQGRIDTRPTSVIRAGSWTMQVQAVDAAGAIVAQGMMATLGVTAGSHVVMDAIDFSGGAFNPIGSDATVAGNWQLNTRAATDDACFALGIDRVRFVLFATSDTAFEEGVTVYQAECGASLLDSRPTAVVRAGSYLWALEAIDSTGALVTEYSETTPLVVTSGSHITLPIVDYRFPETLTIGLAWQAGVGGAYTTCAAAGTDTYSYTLRRGGTIVATATTRPCADLISFNATDTAGFTTGEYFLYFEGFNSGARKQWAVRPGECDNIVVGTGGLVYDECVADFTP